MPTYTEKFQSWLLKTLIPTLGIFHNRDKANFTATTGIVVPSIAIMTIPLTSLELAYTN